MRTLLTAALSLALSVPALAASKREIAKAFAPQADTQTVTLDHSDYGAVLTRYVAETPDGPDTFDYAAVTDEDRAALKGYITRMAGTDPLTLTRNQKIAYWSNLYNAVTLNVVIGAMPVESIKTIIPEGGEPQGFFDKMKAAASGGHGPWTAPLVTVNGMTLTLNNMEHEILRKMDEPRIHYAINCASFGCPDLLAKPWTADTLNADMDAAARRFVNAERGVTVDRDGELVISKIYSWFKEDFGSSDQNVITHLAKYADAERAAMLKGRTKIDDHEYDWSLNSPTNVEMKLARR